MKIVQIAFRNLWRHPKRTLFMSSLVVVGSLFINITISILDGASKGMETSLVGSLTGHLALGAPGEESYGLFGSEIPIVSDYETIPPIDGVKEIFSALDNTPGISSYTSIVSCIANVSISGFSQKSVVFGIDPATYFSVLKDIEILWGDPSELEQGGIFINEQWAKKAESQLNRSLTRGDVLVAAVASRGTFRLRTFQVAGVYRYKAPSEALDRIVLADPTLVRSLVNYTLGNKINTEDVIPATPSTKQSTTQLTTQSDSIDDLFSTEQDVVASNERGVSLDSVEAELKDTKVRDDLVATDAAAWSFILIRKNEQSSLSRLKSDLKRILQKNNLEVRVLDWYTAAGSNALMLFALKAGFNVGVLFLIAGALMMLINSLTISVLERTGEIGTMRALGAQRLYIIQLFFIEILVLSLGSALIGVILSGVVLNIMSNAGIAFKNPLLIGLFGGSILRPQLSSNFVFILLLGIVAATIFASIYPIHLALTVSPREAINESEG